ncbi:MAG: heme o synthase [Chloroflexota bacterium]|nr:heme o synthase [Chloroflexota bacterium]
MKIFKTKLRAYWTLIKSLQTGLLLITGLAGYMSARCPVTTWETLLAVTGSLFLAISGSTVLNMVYDRDIDAKMKRACMRPLPSGQVSVREAMLLGLSLSIAGVGWAYALNPVYGAVVFAGLFFDVVVYTIWLKRRTPYSIIIGGLAGGMPALAGRALAVGGIDPIGILLAIAVLFWIPTHIMTFNLKYAEDYARGGVPTFPSTYGVNTTRLIITLSSIGAAMAIVIAALGVGMTWGYLRLLFVLSAGLLTLAVASMVRPSERLNFGLFKYASIYMLGSMALLAAEAI